MPAADLFAPFTLGPLTLANRIVVAPPPDPHAGDGDVPDARHVEHYARHAAAGLLLSEATQVSRQGKGAAGAPGIHSDAQVLGWTAVTAAVHAAGGRILCRLRHAGRASHPSLQPDNELPVAPSAVRQAGSVLTDAGARPHPTPRALRTDEIPGIVDQFAHAADCALRAGFDGVELHAAEGCLLDQFLRDGTNRRTDRYGGPAANRARLALEVVAAVAGRWGGDRVGIRLSPANPPGDNGDSDPPATFAHLVRELDRFGLAYFHCVGNAAQPGPGCAGLRPLFHGPYMADGGCDPGEAEQALRDGGADLVCFARPPVARPSLGGAPGAG